jgi:hypothetical protein
MLAYGEPCHILLARIRYSIMSKYQRTNKVCNRTRLNN